MRLLTSTKVYRAFPELDRFTDDECERYVAHIVRSTSYRLVMMCIALPVAAASCLIVGLFAFRIVDLFGIYVMPDASRFLLIPVLATVVLMTPGIASLLTRDAILRRYLNHHVGKARCLTCSYSLLGQATSHGIVRCPECGIQTTLSALGLRSEADLLPPT